MFFPETGIPIWKIARMRTVFAVWLPDPLTVATCMLKSFTFDGLAWPEGDPWPTRLDAEDARLRLAHNAGIPGNLTSEMLARLNKDVFAYNPSVLFILGGTNDLGRNVSSATAISRIRYFWIFPVTVIGNSSTNFQ